MLRCLLIAFACFASTCLFAEARAQLVIEVDTINEVLFFTGETTGTPGSPSITAVSTWSTDRSFDGNLLFFQLNPPTLVSNNSGVDSALFLFIDQDFAQLSLLHDATELGELTYTGSGGGAPLPFSFFGAVGGRPFEESAFESLIGTTIPLVDGTGLGDIQIVDANAVPEPTSAIVLCSALALLATRRKRLPIIN